MKRKADSTQCDDIEKEGSPIQTHVQALNGSRLGCRLKCFK